MVIECLRISNGDGEHGSLQLAGDMRSSSNGRIIDSAATFGAASCKDGDSDKASAEKQVKEKTEESEEGDAAEEAGKNDGETGVDDSSTRHTLDRLLPCWNMAVVVC